MWKSGISARYKVDMQDRLPITAQVAEGSYILYGRARLIADLLMRICGYKSAMQIPIADDNTLRNAII
jgi:hypothetical protein